MGRLDVRIVEARNLPNTETFGKPDPYVKIELENAQHKTSVADSTVNPKWDEVFKFTVADPDSAQLVLKLFDKNMVSDAFMGEYKMSIAGLTKGVVKDTWCLLQQCKANAEIHVRLMAHDFGHDPAPGQAAAAVPQQPSPPVQQFQQTPPQQVYQQPPPQQFQQPMMQQQPMYQQQPQMGYPMAQPGYPAAQPGYPGAQPGYPQQQPMIGGMQQMGQFMGQMMAGMQQMTAGMMNQAPSQTWADGQFVQLRGPVRRATYGPAGSQNDVTMAVNGLVQRGQLQIHGGIHTAIGDPFPGVPKQFQVWY